MLTCSTWRDRWSDDSDLWQYFVNPQLSLYQFSNGTVYSWKLVCQAQVQLARLKRLEDEECEREERHIVKATEEFRAAAAFLMSIEDDELLME